MGRGRRQGCHKRNMAHQVAILVTQKVPNMLRRTVISGACATAAGWLLGGRISASSATAGPMLPFGVTPAPPSQRLVGVDYQLWHYRSDWPTWESVWGKPELGYYASGDRNVIRQHARWLSDAGADFILLDWSNQLGADHRTRTGKRWQLTIEDDTVILFDEYAKLSRRPKVAFLLGTPHAPEALVDGRLSRKADQVYEEFVADLSYRPLVQNYLGKPLLVVYVGTPAPVQDGLPTWDDPRFKVRFMTGFVSNQRPLLRPPRISQYGYWSWEDREQPTFPVVNGHPEVMTISPAWLPWPGHIPARGRLGGRTFHEEWQIAREVGPRIVLVAVFNEWRTGEEPSAEVSKDIEPSEQFGHLYLDIMKQEASEFKRGV